MTFHIGDKVRIVNYGHKIWVNGQMREIMKDAHAIGEEEAGLAVDIRRDKLGKEGIIIQASDGGYAIAGIGAWYHEGQLEFVAEATREELIEALQSVTH